jgi:DUF4097 and DUF4098 domain-containing protein YvlB
LTPRPRRSLAGPIVLIIIGTLFLLVNAGIVSHSHIWYLFSHYWPALLIVWGVIKLIEYQNAKRDNVPVRGIGAGGVLLLIFLILAGTAATKLDSVDWAKVRDSVDLGDSDIDIPGFGHTYEYSEQLSQTMPTGSAVKIVNDRGAVNVSVSDDDQIHVSAQKKIRSEEQKEADQWNNSSKPQINVSGNLVTINANTMGAGDHPITTNLDVAIPRKAALAIASKRGDISVIGRDGIVEITNQRGDVSLSDINGNVNLNLDRSSARVNDIDGDVSVDGHSNEVSLNDVKGFARLNGEFSESLKLSRIGKTVSFKTARTDLEFAKLDGDLDLDQGDLRASDLAGPLRLVTRSKDINLEKVAGDARVQNENGSVTLALSSPSNIQIENRQGDIKVLVPDKLGFKVDARSRGGEVSSDFDALKIENGDNNSSISGSVGNGAAHLVLSNEHGSIEVRKNEEVPAPPKPPHPPKSPRTPESPKAPKSSSGMEPTEN